MNLGTIEAGAVAFTRGDGSTVVYIATDDNHARKSAYDWQSVYPAMAVKMVSGLHVEDTEGEWFLFANVDCFDPLVFIVRDRSFEAAYGTFCDEFAKASGILVDEGSASDYPEDERNYNNQGEHIDTEGVQGHQVWFYAATR